MEMFGRPVFEVLWKMAISRPGCIVIISICTLYYLFVQGINWCIKEKNGDDLKLIGAS